MAAPNTRPNFVPARRVSTFQVGGNTMMNDIKPDRDSLMALQALLKIRSDSLVEAEETPKDSTKSKTAVHPKQDALAFQQIIAMKKMAAPPASDAIEIAGASTLSSPSPKRLHQNKVPQATPSPRITPMKPPMTLPPAFSLNPGMTHNSNLAPTPFYSMKIGPVDPFAPPSCAKSSLGPASITKVLVAPETNALINKQVAQAVADKEREEAVRVEKIEAALRSKPQRGRKRENLSAFERLELTRTRNREHAKSTRIRKKARYQELLDNEEKYEELRMVLELRKQRQNCVRCFLSIRESMLHSCLNQLETTLPTKSNGHEPLNAIVTPHRLVTFLESSFSTNNLARALTPSPVGEKMGNDRAEALSEIVHSVSHFEYRIVGSSLVGKMPSSSLESHVGPLAMSAMSEFDTSLASKVAEAAGKDYINTLSYQAEDEVAVNDNGVGFVQVLLKARDCVLISGFLKIQFEQGSAQLKSVEWHTIEEHLDQLGDASDDDSEIPSSSCSSSSEDSFGLQISYPSVVSLDPLCTTERSGGKPPTVDSEESTTPPHAYSTPESF